MRTIDIKEFVEKELKGYHKGIDELKNELVHQGFGEEEVTQAIYRATKAEGTERQQQVERYNRIFTAKELFDRIGFGATSAQLLGILLFQIGGGYFLIGVLSGLRTLIQTIFASVFHEYSKVKSVGKRFVSRAGIIFGFSFLVLAASLAIRSLPLFVLAMLIGVVGVVAHGEPYTQLLERNLKKERMSPLLSSMGFVGVLIVALSLLCTAYLFDAYPAGGVTTTLTLFGSSFSIEVYGFLIAFEATAILFILSGYLLSFVDDVGTQAKVRFSAFAKEYYQHSRMYLRIFSRNSFTRLMLLASVLTSLVQVLGMSYYGIVIYQMFAHQGFGPFLNVAIIFSVALLASLLGTWLTPILTRDIGEAPVLVFGTLLMALLPVAFVYNPNLYALGLATTLAVVGSSMALMSQGLFIRRILNQENARMYFASLSLASALPLLILIPLGAYVASSFGPVFLFKILAALLLFVVAPLYFVIVVKTNKWNQKTVVAQMAKRSGLTYN